MYPKNEHVKALFDAIIKVDENDEKFSYEDQFSRVKRAIKNILASDNLKNHPFLIGNPSVEPENDIDYNDKETGTALTHAIKRHNADITLLLLQKGADIKKAVPVTGRWNTDDEEFITQVFKYAIDKHEETIIQALLPHFENDQEKLVAQLRYALTKNQFDSVTIILKKMKEQKEGEDKLINLFIYAINNHLADMAKALLQADFKQEYLLILLHTALLKNQFEIVTAMLEGIQWSEKSKNRLMEKLTYLIEHGFTNTDMVKAFLRVNIDCNQEDGMGLKSLDYAAIKGNTEIVKALLDAGADPNKLNKERMLPLAYAVAEGHVKTIIALLNGKADMNLLTPDDQAACLSMIAKDQLPKPFAAEKYDDQLIIQLGFVLLSQPALHFSDTTLKKMEKEIFHTVGSYFINHLGDHPTKLPDDFYLLLSSQLLLESDKKTLDSTNEFKIVSSASFLNARDKDYDSFAKHYNQEFFTRLFTPRSAQNLEGYLEDYNFIGKALVRMNSKQYRGLDHFDSAEKSVLEYCLAVLQALNKNTVNNVMIHTSSQEEVKVESPIHYLENKLKHLAEALKKSSSQQQKVEIYYQMAETLKEMGEKETVLENQLKQYDRALRFCLVAKQDNSDSKKDDKINQLASQLKYAYQKAKAQASQSAENSIKQVTGSHALFGDTPKTNPENTRHSTSTPPAPEPPKKDR